MKKLTALLMTLSVGTTLWAMPSQMTVQGTLKQKNVPVNTTKNMQFSFVDGSGSTIPGTVPISVANVQVTNGLFAVQLPIDPSIPWQQYTPYIQISVEGQILSPNQPMNANLYAIAAIPPGMIAMFASSCPTGWTVFTGLQGRFPVGADGGTFTPGSAGGSTTHSHSLGGPTSVANNQWLFGDPQGSGSHAENFARADHVHGVSDASSLPPYRTIVFCQKQ